MVAPVTVQCHPGGVDRLDAPDRVAFDAGHLDEAAHGVAGESEVVFDADLGGVLDLGRGATEHLTEAGGGHRAGGAHLALAADLGTRDRRVRLEQDSDGGGGEQESHDGVLVRAGDESHEVVQHGGQDARGAVRRGRHHASARRILLVDREGEQVDPVHGPQRVIGHALGHQSLMEPGGPPPDAEAAGQDAGIAVRPVVHALLHDRPDVQQRRTRLGGGSPGLLVGEHDLADREALPLADLEQVGPGAERVPQGHLVRGRGAVLQGLLVDDETAPTE